MRLQSDYQDAALWVQQSSLPLDLNPYPPNDGNHSLVSRNATTDDDDVVIINDNSSLTATEIMALQRRIEEQRRRLEQIHVYLQSTVDHDATSGLDANNNPSGNDYGRDYSFIGLAPYVTHPERNTYEADGAVYLDRVVPPTAPVPNYPGFRVVEGMKLVPQSRNPFYYPLHHIQPSSSVNFFDLDFYSSTFLLKPVIDQALATHRPVLSRRIFTSTTSQAYAVILIHPGAEMKDSVFSTIDDHDDVDLPTIGSEDRPRDVAVVAVLIQALLKNVGRLLNGRSNVYSVFLFDSTVNEDDNGDDRDPPYLGGVRFDCDGPCGPGSGEDAERVHFFAPMTLAEVRALDQSHRHEHTWTIASRRWTVIVLCGPGAFRPDLEFLILGSVMIFVACLLISLWLWTNQRRRERYYQLVQAAEAE